MHRINKEGASLSLFDNAMKWRRDHSKETHSKEDRVMTAERLHKALVKPHNLEPLLPRGLKVKLPHSKEEVMLAVHCAKAAVGNLLADPRLDDDSFLWFDNDPLAGPPEIGLEIGDVNTSHAHWETYKALIAPRPYTNCGRRRVLCPFIFYLDGCVTGHYISEPPN